MPGEKEPIEIAWSHEQVEKYRALYPLYQQYAATLKRILELARKKYAPEAIVQARPKSIASFADKIQRKRGKYRDPVHQITDLCGGRVITNTGEEVQAVCRFIKEHFLIDWPNSYDVSQRYRPTEFGYRSVHYVVELRPGVFPLHEGDLHIPVEIPAELYGLKAEIQVRTVLEHAWADVNHRLVYKRAFPVPQHWLRELAALAATLERADKDFDKIELELERFNSSYENYMTREYAESELELLKFVLACDPQNLEIAYKVGKLAVYLGRWAEAVAILQPYADSNYQPILRELGVALYKGHAPGSPEYARGQQYLVQASTAPFRDAEALAALASSWKDIDMRRARDYYHQAFEIDPTASYALGRYLEFEIILSRKLDVVQLLKPLIQQAIERCRAMAEVGVNLPWALYDIGKFYLFLGDPYESLKVYSHAMQLTSAPWMLDASLASVKLWKVVRGELPGYEWIHRLHLLARVVRFREQETGRDRKGAAGRRRARAALQRRATAGCPPLRGPIAIVAGGTDASVEEQMQGYRSLLLEAFRDFQGTVISGGTTSGISGLVGHLQEAYGPALRTVGYMPREHPATVKPDDRYGEIRRTAGQEFSPLEALQYWTDIVAAGIDPAQVKVIGIGGGRIAAAEYRLGLALGARVAIIEQSGREAGRLLADEEWRRMEGLVCLPAEGQIVHSFVHAGTLHLDQKVVEPLAQALHEEYRLRESWRKQSEDPTLAEWGLLPEYFRKSNRLSADQRLRHLRRVGLFARRSRRRQIRPLELTPEEIEALAQMEHARWVVERLQDGWTWGEKRDVAKKTNPLLVSWADLPEQEKAQNREAVRKIPALLAQVGLEVVRGEGGRPLPTPPAVPPS